MEKIKLLLDEIYEDGVCDTLETVFDLQDAAEEILLDALSLNGFSEREIELAAYVVGEYLNICQELIDDEYGIEECECSGDCENCCFYVEE